ncbi:MAG TPA: LLM class flavin-dependent oxidoreductase, partial [Acidimicrobiales bacterium]|nr:LLM class flavin-dependent oxidoreductase [Acidimicrobiales bacterium]
IVAAGRLVFGIGAGGSRALGDNPAVREFEAYGVPLVSPGEALRDLDQSLRVIRRMWTETEPFDFDGASIRLRGAVCEPKPLQRPHPPILVGAWGERAMRVVAEHADIWNCPWTSVEGFAQKNGYLDRCCEAIGRQASDIVRSVQLIIRADDPGEPAASRSVLTGLIEAGATHFVLAPDLGGRPLDWLAEVLVEPLLASANA